MGNLGKLGVARPRNLALFPRNERSQAVAAGRSSREKPMTEIPELTDQDFARAIPARVRKRLMMGQLESGEDIAALRRFVGLTQDQFAQAMGISIQTLGNWEQGQQQPGHPAIALLRIAARHPRILRENLQSAA